MNYFRNIALALALSLTATIAHAQSQGFTLKGVSFSKSAYLAEEQLQSTVAPYLNRTIQFADVQAMVAAVQQLYSAAGIVTAKVVLLPQTVENGVLKLDLVEAKIGTVNVAPLGGTKPEFMRKNVSLAPGTLPDYALLERDLRVFEISHDFVPKLTFAPGVKFGTVDVEIGGDVPKRRNWTASFDNFGTKESGAERLTLSMRMANMSGVRDTLSLQAQLSKGTALVAGGYSRPVGPGGGRMTGTFSYSRSKVINGVFTPIDIVSDSAQISFGYRRPFRVKPDSYFLFDVNFVAESGKSRLTAVSFQKTDVYEIVPQVSYSRTRDKYSFNAGLGLKIGTANTAQTSQTEGTYVLAFGNLGYARRLGKNFLMEASATFQYAQGQNLPVPRLISAGGATTVRGYPNNVRSGDSGIYLRAQFSKIEPWQLGTNVKLTPFGFIDAAAILPYRVAGGFNSKQDLLYSVGFGGRFDFGKKWSLLAMAAAPLKDTLGFQAKGKNAFYLGLDYRF